jgi:hypothetical protein
LNPFQRVLAMSLGIHSKVGCATHEPFANRIFQVAGVELRTAADDRLNWDDPNQ